MKSPTETLAEFKVFLKESAGQLEDLWGRPAEFKGDGGTVVHGWSFRHYDKKGEEIYRPNETPIYQGGNWGHGDVFLTADGEIYRYEFNGVDELVGHEIKTTSRNSVSKVSLGELIGTKEPFEEVIREINALVLKALASKN